MSIKKSLKTFSDSNNVNSYTGGLYNATYSINLNTIITNSDDLNKLLYVLFIYITSKYKYNYTIN